MSVLIAWSSNMGIPKRLDEFGCYVMALFDSGRGHPTDAFAPIVIFHMPTERDNASLPDDEWVEVSAPESQEFLDAVNEFYGTFFEMSDFPGR